jgi:esterase/lipase
VLPVIVKRRVNNAKAVSANLRSTASEFPNTAPRLTQAAQTIDELIALLESATWVAKLNHDTIVNREAS